MSIVFQCALMQCAVHADLISRQLKLQMHLKVRNNNQLKLR